MIDRVAFLVQTGLNRPSSSNSSNNKNSNKSWDNVSLFPRFVPAEAAAAAAGAAPHHAMLACSAAADVSREHRELFGMRRLGEDRKGFLDHLKPASFVKGVVRVTMTQGSTIYSTYLSDQLREDMKRDEQVNEGRLSRSEAEQQADEWAQQEWPKRWESFPKKLAIAYAKYHAITIVMRIYESISAKMFNDDVMVDKLTIDTYSSTLRRDKVGQRVSNRELFTECWYANCIAYLADYSVHQVILAFGYFLYIRDQQRRLKSKKAEEADEAKNELHPGSLVLSFTKKSVSLAFTRAVGLLCASIGGAVGASLMPGWGSVIGINMGDGLAISITDEIVSV